ncbi:MAG: O-antigen ligase domain-containing protein [Candidatus Brocadia sp.]|nr:O-antigen ligase domain-containing protein [Candidatus Brocadia sp.]
MLRIQQSNIVLYFSFILLALFFAGTILFLKPTYFIALVGILVALPLVVLYPGVGLVFYATSLGFVDPIFDSLGVPSGLRALPIASLLVILLVFFIIREKKGLTLGGVHFVGIGIGIILFTGLLWTRSPNYGMWKVQAYMLYSLLLLLGTALFVGERERLKRIIYTAAFLGVVFSFMGLYTISAGEMQKWGRLTIGSFDPIWLARGMGVFSLALLMLFEITRSQIMKIFLLTFLFCLMFLILSTASRGPTFSLFLTLLFYFLFFFKKPLVQKVVFIAIVGIIICVAFIYMPQEVRDRYNFFTFSASEQGTDYTTGRMPLFTSAFHACKSHPLLGLGTGGFSSYYSLVDARQYPHNLFLEMGSELGILGLGLIICFLCLNFRMIFSIFRKHRRITQDNFPLVWGALIFFFEFCSSMVSGDLMANKLLFLGSGFMWTAYMTDKVKERTEGLKGGR